jgi:hypothetical protein
MFQMMGAVLKASLFAFAILVGSHLVTINQKTISQHVATGLQTLSLLPAELPSARHLSNTANQTATQTLKTLKRAWGELPEVGVQAPQPQERANARSAGHNPHRENHSSESRRDLNDMLQSLRNRKVSSRE